MITNRPLINLPEVRHGSGPHPFQGTILRDSEASRASLGCTRESYPNNEANPHLSEPGKEPFLAATTLEKTNSDPLGLGIGPNEAHSTIILNLQHLPGSWDATHPADKMMFYMRQEDAKWKDIARKWRGMTGGNCVPEPFLSLLVASPALLARCHRH